MGSCGRVGYNMEEMDMGRPPPYSTTRRALDPRRSNIALDANAIDRDGTVRDDLVDRFLSMRAAQVFNVVIAAGVRQEVMNIATPDGVKKEILPRFFNLQPELIPSQHNDRRRVREVLQGNAKPGKHAADASHLSEAAEVGCAFFITHDARILDKRGELREVIPPTLTIVTLDEFFQIYDDYAAGRL